MFQGSPATAASELRSISLFAFLTNDQLVHVGEIAQRQTYERGDVVSRPGAETGAVYLLTKGTFRATRPAHGRTATVEEFAAGDAWGLSLLCPSLTPQSWLEVTSALATSYRLSQATFEHLCDIHPLIYREVIQVLVQRIGSAATHIEELVTLDASQRLAHTLARKAALRTDRLVIDTHDELAALVGTRREHVSRMLQDMRTGKLIERGTRGGNVVPDPEALLLHYRCPRDLSHSVR
jgi:CRP-like cAMP-binding protein